MSNLLDMENLLDCFKELGAIEFAKPGQEFTLKSGKKSNFYLDCRLVSLDAAGAAFLAEMFVNSISEQLDDLSSEESRTYVGATGVGGAPLVGAILHLAGEMELLWQGFVVRDVEKGHGLKKKVEGHYGSDGHIVLVEDVVTSGSSILDAAAAVREKGFTPIGVHCIVDREEGARDALKAAGLPLFSLLKLGDLLALENHMILNRSPSCN